MQNKRFQNTLREHRVRIGLRQIDVAQKLGLDCADRLSRWENGLAIPNIVNLFRLSTLYKIAPEQLYPDLYEAVRTLLGDLKPSTPSGEINPTSANLSMEKA